MRNLLIVISLVILPTLASCQDKVDRYTSLYADIAISEMLRSGIPASITLAQGMFESSYGESSSAMSYNNHFGIKCKKEWTGPFYYKHDDDRDKNGKLIPSCFRAYPTVLESYQDHTNFLMERERYAELFTFHQTDYTNWALGLERCGYATNKMYAERLIDIIDRYALNQFDHVREIVEAPVEEAIDEDVFESAVIASASAPVEVAPVIIEPVVVEPTISEPVVDEGVILATYDEEDLFKVVEIPAEPVVTKVVVETITSPVLIDTIPATRLVIEAAPAAPVNRVNKAIMLPSNYKRSVKSTSTSSSKMK